MSRLSVEDVAVAAGTTADVVREMAEIGVVLDGAGSLVAADIVRVRLALALEGAGVSRGDLAAALQNGRLSFDYVGTLMPEPVRLLPDNHAQVQEALGLAPEFADRMRAMLGARVSLDDPIREDDAELLGTLARALELGAPPERVLGILRAMIESVQRLVWLQRQFVDDVLLAPAIGKHGSALEALVATSAVRREYRLIGRDVIAQLHERIVDDAVFENLAHMTEAALIEGGVPHAGPVEAIAFVDVSGYTTLAEQAGDVEAAEQASRLADFTQSSAADHHGRLVKALGDGAMLHFPSPTQAVRGVLDIVQGANEHGLWPLHAGVNAGTMVRRDGDYFGTTVNVASRTADQARQGETIVTATVTEAWDGGQDVSFIPIGQAQMRHVAQPVTLFRAERAH